MSVCHRMAVWIGLAVFSVTQPALAVTMYSVSIDTSAVNGTDGQLAFDFVKNNSAPNEVEILNFSTDGTLGVPITEGGLVSGDLILGINPAPFTVIEGGFFFNELIVTPQPFGNEITFSLGLTENFAPGTLPDELAVFLLDASGMSLFPTGDPSGADALFTIDITGSAGGNLQVFEPTQLTGPTSLAITVPGAVTPTPEPGLFGILLIAMVMTAASRAGLRNRLRHVSNACD